MRKLLKALLCGSLGLLGALLPVGSASAHVEFDPAKVPAESSPRLDMVVENENPTGTVKVQLVFPKRLVVVEIEPVAGWTSAVDGGAFGGSAEGITWSRETADAEDPHLPFTIGPVPRKQTKLQFKVIQTYADGSVDRWIEKAVPGAPEPELPMPVLRVRKAKR